MLTINSKIEVKIITVIVSPQSWTFPRHFYAMYAHSSDRVYTHLCEAIYMHNAAPLAKLQFTLIYGSETRWFSIFSSDRSLTREPTVQVIE